MTHIATAVGELHRCEHELASALLMLADGHRADHDLYHVGRDVAAWSRRHVGDLAAFAERHGLGLDPAPRIDDTVLETEGGRSRDLFADHGGPGLVMLSDLRAVYRVAAGVALGWEALTQAALALADRELLDLAGACHPETLRQLRWVNASLKENAAQIIVYG